RGLALLNVVILSQPADDALARTGAGDVKHVADSNGAEECVRRLGDGRKVELQLAQARFGAGVLLSDQQSLRDWIGRHAQAEQHADADQAADFQEIASAHGEPLSMGSYSFLGGIMRRQPAKIK